jgi:hypothetical protein
MNNQTTVDVSNMDEVGTLRRIEPESVPADMPLEWRRRDGTIVVKVSSANTLTVVPSFEQRLRIWWSRVRWAITRARWAIRDWFAGEDVDDV